MPTRFMRKVYHTRSKIGVSYLPCFAIESAHCVDAPNLITAKRTPLSTPSFWSLDLPAPPFRKYVDLSLNVSIQAALMSLPDLPNEEFTRYQKSTPVPKPMKSSPKVFLHSRSKNLERRKLKDYQREMQEVYV